MTAPRRAIFCCACNAEVQARMGSGAEVYPHRSDLHPVPFWICDGCRNYVGCHWRSTSDPTRPLGVIPTPELRRARQHIHRLIDPLWKRGRIKRSRLYNRISVEFGREFHSADLRTVDEARAAYRIALAIAKELGVTPEGNGP